MQFHETPQIRQRKAHTKKTRNNIINQHCPSLSTGATGWYNQSHKTAQQPKEDREKKGIKPKNRKKTTSQKKHTKLMINKN